MKIQFHSCIRIKQDDYAWWVKRPDIEVFSIHDRYVALTLPLEIDRDDLQKFVGRELVVTVEICDGGKENHS